MRRVERQQLSWSRCLFSIEHLGHASAKNTVSEIIPDKIIPSHHPQILLLKGNSFICGHGYTYPVFIPQLCCKHYLEISNSSSTHLQ